MKTSWITAASLIIFSASSVIAALFPGTTVGVIAQGVALVSGYFGHQAQPLIKQE